jgi:hypothetical protein
MSDHIPGPGKMVSARDDAVERALMAAWCNPPTSSGMTDAEAFCTALAAAGYAVVPVEPSVAMLQDGYDARLAARHPGVSGQTIDASMRATAYRELAIYRAMLAAAKETQA